MCKRQPGSSTVLSNEHARSTHRFNFLLRGATEKLGLDDDRLIRKMTLAEHFVVAGSNDVDDGRNFFLGLVLKPRLIRDERPESVDIESWTPVLLLSHMKVTHAYLAKVTRMVFIKVDAMMMLTASITATSGMLPVLTNTAVTVAHMTAHLAAFLLLSRTHSSWILNRKENKQEG